MRRPFSAYSIPPQEPVLPVAALARQLRATFDRVASFTVGAEEELLLIDPDTFELSPAIGDVLAAFDGDRRVRDEFRASQVEFVSPVCVSVVDVVRELRAVRRLANLRLRGVARLLAVGTHPTAAVPGPLARRPHHERIEAENPLAAHGLLTCGLHVHVAVGGAERALAVHNALRSYLPEIGALGANAPFHCGADSGLASVRPHLNRVLPRFGVPPAFPSWESYADIVARGRDIGIAPDSGPWWWDLRLDPSTGTIEVRGADSQTQLANAGALIALVQSLTCHLANQYAEGELLETHPSERIAKNMWLAARDGVHGSLVDLTTAERVPTAERLHELVELLLPTADTLGCRDELLDIGRMIREGGGAGGQRRLARARGLSGLLSDLSDQTTGRLEQREADSGEPERQLVRAA